MYQALLAQAARCRSTCAECIDVSSGGFVNAVVVDGFGASSRFDLSAHQDDDEADVQIESFGNVCKDAGEHAHPATSWSVRFNQEPEVVKFSIGDDRAATADTTDSVAHVRMAGAAADVIDASSGQNTEEGTSVQDEIHGDPAVCATPTDDSDCILEDDDGGPFDQEPSVFNAYMLFHKGGRRTGMQTDITQHGYLRINSLTGKGSVAVYNRHADIDKKIREGDCIVSVNGECVAAKQASLLMEGGSIEIEIRRPRIFTVSGLEKAKGSLGLSVVYYQTSTAAYITQVNADGLVQAYNQTRPRSLQVRPGDLIVAVNGQRGSTGGILKMMAEAETLDLTIERPED